MNRRVAVVILNYNGAEMLAGFLPLVQEFSPEADVVVADNASTDNSVELVRSKFPDVTLIALDRNYGFADGYNKALEQVDAEYYILLNSDVEVTPGWIAPLLSFMDARREVVACQPKVLDYKDKAFFEYAGASGGFVDRYGYPYCRGRLFETVEKDCGQYDDACRIFWATGAAMMVRSKEYWAVGGLDGRFFAHMEEIDLCWRMNARGGELYCVPQSVVRLSARAIPARHSLTSATIFCCSIRTCRRRNLPMRCVCVCSLIMWRRSSSCCVAVGAISGLS